MSQTLSNLGNVLFAEKEYHRALEDLFESLSLIESLDDKYSLVISLGAISDVYLKLKNFDKAHLYLDRALSIAKEINANELIKDAYKGLYLIYKETGKHETALKYQTLYYQLHDSIYSQKSKSKIAELQNKYIFEKKEQEIKLLEAERKMNDIQLRNSRILSFVLIVGITVSLFFLGLVYFQMNRKKQANIELVRKNKEIVKSEEYTRKLQTDLKKEEHLYKENLNEKYATSTLSEKQKENLELLITSTMENEKLYLNDSFTIEILSKHLDVSRTYISQVINEKFNMNFNKFINEFRVKEARRMLSGEESKKLTIETIASSVGFGCKSSFNTAFKKYTGVTPSFYMRSSR
jgi:AraC-like DNA-binding protein